jgi:hypothetical protein
MFIWQLVIKYISILLNSWYLAIQGMSSHSHQSCTWYINLHSQGFYCVSLFYRCCWHHTSLYIARQKLKSDSQSLIIRLNSCTAVQPAANCKHSNEKPHQGFDLPHLSASTIHSKDTTPHVYSHEPLALSMRCKVTCSRCHTSYALVILLYFVL